MPRLFISHSSKDNIEALAVQRWLELKGWSKEDVFIDLHDMRAGEKWRDTLVKANVACQALLYLASDDSLGSEECRREVRRAEDDRKDVIVAILRGVTLDDPRLSTYADRQIMDLSTKPREDRVEVELKGERHLIDFNRAAINAIHTRLIKLGIAPNAFVWPPRDNPKALPYPGLDAFDEHSAGIYFGREADVMAGIRDLRQIRHRGAPRMLVIQAASGAGKSSFLKAGIWPRLGRTAEFVPIAILRPATGIVTGQQGLGQGLARWFGDRGQALAPGAIHGELMAGDAAAGAALLADYLSQAQQIVEAERALGSQEGKEMPRLAPLIAIDQGEELFAAEDATESNRFLEMLGKLLGSPPAGLDPFVLVTIRADSVDALLQRVPQLGLVTPHMVALPPLSPAAYRDVITKPAEVYSRAVGRLDLEPELVGTLIQDATGADALPLLAFTLQRLYTDYAPGRTVTKAHYDTMGGIEGSIDKKLAEAKGKTGTAGTDAGLRRLIVPGLATWDPAANSAKRLVANEAELLAGDRKDLAPLAEALVKGRLLTRGKGTLEVAHEALLRRQPIAGWLDQQKDGLKLRDDVLREAGEWTAGKKHAKDLVRRGERLKYALDLRADPGFASALVPAKDYLEACQKVETGARRAARRTRGAIFMLMLATIAGLVGVIYKAEIEALRFRWMEERSFIANNVAPFVLKPEAERALKPGDPIHECGHATHCPEMIVLPAGTFVMGSPDGKTAIIGLDGKPMPDLIPPEEGGRRNNEGPQHEVTISKPFAVSKYEVTWDDWEACVAMRGCDGAPTGDQGFGRGRKPVINVSWDQAKAYAAWLSRMMGQDYRLLSEAEWEYAARGVVSSSTRSPRYPWGDDDTDICKHANLADISFHNSGYTSDSAQCDDGQAATSEVGQYPANLFGLYDMHGNVWEWVEDCYVENYDGAPADGTARTSTDCSSRVLRGGSWGFNPQYLRSALRNRNAPSNRYNNIGFRLARTLLSP